MGFDMPSRPTKRREPLSETYIFQLRIDLVDARPPIWRRVEIRSDVNLWTLHRVIQGAFDWWDAHLYRFSLGGPHSWDSELFLCNFDMTDGEDEGTFVGDVRLDEALQQPGDQLDYLYDYGDDWHHTIKLEKVRPALPQDPVAVCTGGRRAAPPEDSGGIADVGYLAEMIEDPAFFDLDATNELIGHWLETPGGFAPAGSSPERLEIEHQEQALLQRFPQFRQVLDHCHRQDTRAEILHRLQELETLVDVGAARLVPDESTLSESLGAVQSTLDEIGSGVKLTGAGYLPPKIAYRVGEALGLAEFQLSSGGESKMIQVLHFREALQHAGLLRKYKGELLLTKAAKDGLEATPHLWNHLAARLLPAETAQRSFAHDAGLLALLFAATSDGDFGLATVADLLTVSGWRINNEPVQRHDVAFQGSWQTILLWYVAPKDQRAWFSNIVSPAAAELVRAALIRMRPASEV